MIYAAWPPGPTGAKLSDPHLVGDLKPAKWHTRWCETRSHGAWNGARAGGEWAGIAHLSGFRSSGTGHRGPTPRRQHTAPRLQRGLAQKGSEKNRASLSIGDHPRLSKPLISTPSCRVFTDRHVISLGARTVSKTLLNLTLSVPGLCNILL